MLFFFLGCQTDLYVIWVFLCRYVYGCHKKWVFGACIDVGCCYLIQMWWILTWILWVHCDLMRSCLVNTFSHMGTLFFPLKLIAICCILRDIFLFGSWISFWIWFTHAPGVIYDDIFLISSLFLFKCISFWPFSTFVIDSLRWVCILGWFHRGI